MNVPIRVHKLQSRGKVVGHMGLLENHLVVLLLPSGYLSENALGFCRSLDPLPKPVLQRLGQLVQDKEVPWSIKRSKARCTSHLDNVRVIQHRKELGLDCKVDGTLEKFGLVLTRFLRQLLDCVSGTSVPDATSFDEAPHVALIFLTGLLLVIISGTR